MVLRWPYARLVRRCKLPKLKVASFIGGACYGCLLVMAASFFMWGFFWGIPFGGSDVLSVLFGGTDARVDARAVASGVDVALAGRDLDPTLRQMLAAATPPPSPRREWPSRQPDATRWGWQPDGATGCHPFCTAKHCGSRPDCASCGTCPNQTKALPWAEVAHRSHHHAQAAVKRPAKMSAQRYAALRRNASHGGSAAG